MLGNVAGRWRGWLLNDAEHQGCVLHTADLAQCTVRLSGVPRNFVRGGGGSTNSVEDRENGHMGALAP